MDFDLLDATVLGTIVCAAVYFLFLRSRKATSDSRGVFSSEAAPKIAAFTVPNTPLENGNSSAQFVDDSDFVGKLKQMGAQIAIFYGSQTGTAEDFSLRIAREAKRYSIVPFVADIQDYEMECLQQVAQNLDKVVIIFCVATYGEGEPTDNAQGFYNFLKDKEESGDEFDLSGLKFAVFGLGNKTYDHFNAMGKFVDKMLDKLGGNRVVELGLGDDDANMEEDFVNWKDQMWPQICSVLGKELAACDGNFRQYEMRPDMINPTKVFTGEPHFFDSFNKQKRPFTQKNPFLASVVERRELYDDDNRSCLHIELDIAGSSLRYNAGDHVAVYPHNNPELVDTLGTRLGINLEDVFYLHTTDQYSKKKTPFPCPCSFRTALTSYVDITSLPGHNILQELIQYAEDADEKKRLQDLVSKEGRSEFNKYIHDECRTISEVLHDFKSVKIPADHLLELLPRLQPRLYKRLARKHPPYYSISSSPKLCVDKIHITAAVVRYTTPTGRQGEGVATTWLERLNLLKEKVPIFVRRSTFRLPSKPSTPVIMIGPGTGLAPFRGFLQERQALLAKGKELGKALLFFGCQQEAKHFMYREELENFLEIGALSELHTAFSRDQKQKIYVQHLMLNCAKSIWEIIKAGGHLYICGDAKHMARDVNRALVEIIKTQANLSTQDSEGKLKTMQQQRRFQQDVWS